MAGIHRATDHVISQLYVDFVKEWQFANLPQSKYLQQQVVGYSAWQILTSKEFQIVYVYNVKEKQKNKPALMKCPSFPTVIAVFPAQWVTVGKNPYEWQPWTHWVAREYA